MSRAGTALYRALLLASLVVAAVPAAASAATASFKGTCDFTGTVTETVVSAVGAQTTVDGTGGSCNGQLVRADGVVIGPKTFPARLRISQMVTLPLSALGSCFESTAGQTGGTAAITFLDVYPLPLGDPADERIDTAVDVAGRAGAITGQGQLEYALSGLSTSTYPAGTHATFAATPAQGCGPTSASTTAFSGKLTTGPSPTAAGSIDDVLIDR